MSDQTAKQQIVDRLKDVDTVLVTVSTDPSVDELSAALGFTLLVNKLNKHATAVFSGAIPPAITFLDPEKTFENTVDSLRDFIIALDKEKADHLRYKVDGDMVKIFITPYRTTITDKDLDFSQGDYNVEMVIAIGVKNNDDLDKALADHGKILHDATVAALSLGSDSSDLGSINWHENDVSSYCEMLVGIAESLRSDKTLIDEQIATAFLTGIVAATERFSNEHTTSKTMTMAAQLMAAGANQQLIATKLAEGGESISMTEGTATEPTEKKHLNDGTTSLDDGELTKVDRTDEPEPAKDKPAPDGSMSISHEHEGDVDEVAKQVEARQQAQATAEAHEQLESLQDQSHTTSPSSDDELAAHLAAPSTSLSVADLQSDIKAASDELESAASSTPDMSLPAPTPVEQPLTEPSLGGTLNATTDQAAIDARQAAENERNRTILSHNSGQYVGHPPVEIPPINSLNQPASALTEPPAVDPFGGSGIAPYNKTVAPLDPSAQALPSADPAGASALPSLAAAPFAPVAPGADTSISTTDTSLPPLPPLPDFSTLPPLPGTPPVSSSPTDQLAASLSDVTQQPPVATPAPTPASNDDPGQFKIPGQP